MENGFVEKFIMWFGLMLVVLIIGFFIVRGINEVIENQDRMLCESALISKNREYLIKCECYYQSNDITCLQK